VNSDSLGSGASFTTFALWARASADLFASPASRGDGYADALVVTTGEHASTLEHLAEMDRLLRDIQVELEPGRDPAPALETPPPDATSETPQAPSPPVHEPPDSGASISEGDPATPEAPPPAELSEPTPQVSEPAPQLFEPTLQLQALSQLAARLLASMRELLDGYEQFLVQIPAVRLPAAARPPTPTPQQAPPRDVPDVTVAAGPFVSLDALRSFEHAVSGLPGVRDVAVRGYEGSDRAIIEVRLDRNGG
jgi:hypothetical protein